MTITASNMRGLSMRKNLSDDESAFLSLIGGNDTTTLSAMVSHLARKYGVDPNTTEVALQPDGSWYIQGREVPGVATTGMERVSIIDLERDARRLTRYLGSFDGAEREASDRLKALLDSRTPDGGWTDEAIDQVAARAHNVIMALLARVGVREHVASAWVKLIDAMRTRRGEVARRNRRADLEGQFAKLVAPEGFDEWLELSSTGKARAHLDSLVYSEREMAAAFLAGKRAQTSAIVGRLVV